MNRWVFCILGLLFLAVCVAGPTLGQQPLPPPEDPEGAPDGELRQAMRRYLHNQLRMELALSDEQMAQLTPHIERIEGARSDARRERMTTLRQLQHGLREGAGDEQLQSLLDRLDAIENEQRAAERAAMTEIDGMLTVRQRVQFRFFVQRFRKELQQRVQQLRRDRRP